MNTFLDVLTRQAETTGNLLDQSPHIVQFYDSERFLETDVASYLDEGLTSGGSVIFVATAAHLESLLQRLRLQGHNLDALRARGRLYALDADETLTRIMIDDAPDPMRFHKVIGELVASCFTGGGNLRVFGEMVTLLWSEGKREAALELEELWNVLCRAIPFSLYCAYPLKGFNSPEDADMFAAVCAQHGHVLPTESYTVSVHTPGERLREIASLQQKALSLETEIEQRKRAQQELVQSKAQLSSFVESATLGLHWVDSQGIVIWANPADYEPLGYSHEEYIGHHITEFHADPDTISDILARLGRDEKLQEYPARLLAKDGSIRKVLIDSSVLWENGRFVHTQCFTRLLPTVSDRDHFTKLLESVPTISWIVEQNRLTFINEAGRAFFGPELAELAGDGWHQRFEPNDAAMYLRNLTSGHSEPMQLRCRDRHGHWRRLLIQSRPLQPGHGCRPGFISSGMVLGADEQNLPKVS